MKKIIIALMGAIAVAASSCSGELTTTTAVSGNGVVVSIVKKWRFRHGNVYEVREMYNKLEEEFEVPEATVSLSGKSVYLFDKEYK